MLLHLSYNLSPALLQLVERKYGEHLIELDGTLLIYLPLWGKILKPPAPQPNMVPLAVSRLIASCAPAS